MSRFDRHTDEQILGELAWVRSLARQMLSDPSLADDVVQDVWLAAHQHGPAEAGSGLRAWLHAVTRNRVRRLVRTDRRRTAREQAVAATTSTTAESPADVVERAALHRETMDAVMALDEPYRQALLLRYLDGLDATEVARRQGVSHAAARQRLSRGMQMLRERIERTHPGGFGAFCFAWQRDFAFASTTAATTAAAAVPFLFLMKLPLLVGGLLAASLLTWTLWPAPDATVAPPSVARGGADETRAAVADTVGSQAQRAAVAADAVLAFEVVDAQQRAVPDATVLVLHEGELVATAVTDAAGRATFGDALRGTEVMLVANGMLPLRLPCRGAEVQRVVWRNDHGVSGEVRGAGEALVSLELEHDAVDPCWTGLGPRATAALAALGAEPRTITITVPSSGTFGFGGLRADWSGALTAGAFAIAEPSGLGSVEQEHSLLLREPVRGLVLELRAPVLIRGRVVADGTPVAGLDVATSAYTGGAYGPSIVAATGADGTFAVGLQRLGASGPLNGTLTVGSSFAWQRVRVAADATVHDVGDVVVGAPLHVRVVSEDGIPVAGARVAAIAPSGLAATGHSDASGAVTFVATTPDAVTVVVEAPGHARASAPIPTDRRLTVQLRAVTGLSVVVVDTAGAPMRGSLRVQADRLPFVLPRQSDGRVEATQPFDQVFPLERDGSWSGTEFVPGVLLRLSARDGNGDEVAHTEVVAPLPKQHVDVTLRSDRVLVPPPSLVVRDENGRPVSRARVHAEQGDYVDTGRTDAAGAFRFQPMQAQKQGVHLEVVHPGFVPFVQKDAVLAPGAAPIEVTLVRGRRLVVQLRQANGRAARAGHVTLGGGASGLATAADATGAYVFENVARQAATITVTLAGGRSFAQEVPATAELAEVRLPDLADVVITLGEGLGAVDGKRVAVVITPLEPTGDADRLYVGPEVLAGTPLPLQLAPGRYRLQVELRQLARRTVETRGAPRELDVQAGASLHFVLP